MTARYCRRRTSRSGSARAPHRPAVRTRPRCGRDDLVLELDRVVVEGRQPFREPARGSCRPPLVGLLRLDFGVARHSDTSARTNIALIGRNVLRGGFIRRPSGLLTGQSNGSRIVLNPYDAPEALPGLRGPGARNPGPRCRARRPPCIGGHLAPTFGAPVTAVGVVLVVTQRRVQFQALHHRRQLNSDIRVVIDLGRPQVYAGLEVRLPCRSWTSAGVRSLCLRYT